MTEQEKLAKIAEFINEATTATIISTGLGFIHVDGHLYYQDFVEIAEIIKES